MSNNLKLYEEIRSVPAEAQKTITGGRLNGFTDINPMWRIKTLTDQYGECGKGWYVKEIGREFKEGANGETAVFIDIELYVKIGDEWSKPILGTGGSRFIAKERSGMYTDDEAVKKAHTDALGVACKALGMGADIYWQADRTKYTPLQVAEKQPAEKQAKPTVSAKDSLIETLYYFAQEKGYTPPETAHICYKKYGLRPETMTKIQLELAITGFKNYDPKQV